MLIKVFDTEGKEHLKESVDARECVAVMGWSLSEPKPAEEAEPEQEPKPAVNIGNKNNFNPKR
jgi:hypothetical protein